MDDEADPPRSPSVEDLTAQLDRLVAGRASVLDRIVVSARQAGVGALLLIGSLGRGGGDAFSDLDLIAVPGPGFDGFDLARIFGTQVLSSLDAPRNAPVGGDYLGLCLEVSQTALWVDWYLWPPGTAVIPADATPIYDNLGLEASEQGFVPLIKAHNDPTARAHLVDGTTELLRIAVAAKYLARKDLLRLVAKMPDAQGLSLRDIPDLLRRKLADITAPHLFWAATATGHLVDLAAVANENGGSPPAGSDRR